MSRRRNTTQASCAAVLSIVLSGQQIAGAQVREPNLVGRGELRAALRSAADRRDANLQKIRELLRQSDVACIGERLTDMTRVSRSLTALDDRTLERLAIQSDKVSEELHGEGAGKVLLIIALILLILVVVAALSLPESS